MIKKYTVLEVPVNSGAYGSDIKVGDVIYDCDSHDYGCAYDDSLVFGEEYESYTKDPTGSYPFFTLPVRCAKEITNGG